MKKLVLALIVLLSGCWQEHHYDLPDLGDNEITYHGGNVMNNGVNVYFIWYGNWINNTAPTILTNLITGLNGSPYFNTNTLYYDYTGKFVINSVTMSGSTTDSYSRGSAISDADVYSIVADAINQGRLPLDENGIYFVLTSADVDETGGFCTQNCGWHSYMTLQNKDIKVAWIGDAINLCQTNGNNILMNGSKQGLAVDQDGDGDVQAGAGVYNSCIFQTNASPNNNVGADGMASVVTHELSEATTDPNLDAWYDTDTTGECADKCAWTFDPTYKVSNGSIANVNLAGMDFLIQRNWVNANGGFCALSH